MPPSVHVESSADTQLRGRAGRHCGQKRTYRAVSGGRGGGGGGGGFGGCAHVMVVVLWW